MSNGLYFGWHGRAPSWSHSHSEGEYIPVPYTTIHLSGCNNGVKLGQSLTRACVNAKGRCNACIG